MRCRHLQLTLLECREVPAIVAATWDGGGTDNNWMTAANWVGNVAPQPGDALLFPAGAARLMNFNNFPAGTDFASISMTGLNYFITGNPVSLTGNITATLPAGSPIDVDPILSFNIALGKTTIDVSARSLLLSGSLNGSNGLVKTGTGKLILGAANTYGGATNVNAGILQIRADSALGAIGNGNETHIADGASLELSGLRLTVAEPIAFAGQGVNRPHPPTGDVGPDGAIANVTGDNTLTGPLTLTADGLIAGDYDTNADGIPNRLTITSGITEAGGSHNLTINVHGTGAVFSDTAVNSITGLTTVSYGTVFNGKAIGPFQIDGNLQGHGSVGAVTGSSTGELAPDGAFATKDLNLAQGVLALSIGPSDYDRLIVTGTVRLGGTLTEATSVVGQERQVKPGEQFRIIDNDGSDPVVGTFKGLPEGAIVSGASYPVPLRISYYGGDGNDVVLIGVSQTAFAVGEGPGGEPRVNIYDGGSNLIHSFLAYPAGFRGGLHVATVDVNHDSVPDIITGAGPGGGPLVRIFDGTNFALIREFYAYDQSFAGGVFVAAADVFPDGKVDIITGAGPGGGPHVKVFDGGTFAERSSFFAYDPNFRGGVSVAASPGANVSHVFFLGSIITGAGPGGGPHVRIFDATGHLNGEFFAYDPDFRGGVAVATGGQDLQGLGNFSVVTSPMSDALPIVRIFDSRGNDRASFFAYDQAFRGGFSVAALPIGLNGQDLIVTGAGPSGGPHVREWSFDAGPTVRQEFFAFDPAFTGGIWVG